ncbi:cell division protein FtsQ/DivIB [Lacticaseibacillus jixiensis]|uniref:cell division protein FtsQ/DivIB n=1 Tax=Lacticaseibacillus jixiensis TaxID=3231926 RepID=UPI0036F318D6
MARWHKTHSDSPLTPWEAYQAKQAKQARAKRHALPLPQLSHTRNARRRRNLALLLTPLCVLLAAGAYMISPLAKVGQLKVLGESTVPAQSVIDASKLGSSQVILDLLLHKDTVAKRVKAKLPQVQQLHVDVNAFNQVTLHVKEYAPLGYLAHQDGYHVLLASGTLLRSATQTPTHNYPIYAGFSTKEAFKLAKVVHEFPPAVARGVSEVHATRGAANPYQITISMNDGNKVIADSRTVAKKIKYYPQLLASVTKKGTVDLEVGAFFTPYAK